MGPVLGSLKPMGRPKVHGLRGHCTPLPPLLSVALGIAQPILKHEERRLRCSGNLGLGGRQTIICTYAASEFYFPGYCNKRNKTLYTQNSDVGLIIAVQNASYAKAQHCM